MTFKAPAYPRRDSVPNYGCMLPGFLLCGYGTACAQDAAVDAVVPSSEIDQAQRLSSADNCADQKNFAEAMKIVNAVLETDPDHADALFAQADFYDQIEDYWARSRSMTGSLNAVPTTRPPLI